ncbi:MAG: rhomboid family intramembrane serine protease [Vampirovibrionales bacterium]|nr:rhomboid family intramembrane serine protease [Vampirovibrionales bacterium]
MTSANRWNFSNQRINTPVTARLLGVMVLIYAATSVDTHFIQASPVWLMLGSFSPAALRAGHLWVWLSAPLMHVNWQHLGSNAFGIWIFGRLLEPFLGSWRFLMAFVFSAFMSLMFSLWFHSTPTVGASGGVYGYMGLYLTLVLMSQSQRARFFQTLRSIVVFLLVFWLMGLQTQQSVNVWGHVGGLLGGVLFALALAWPFSQHRGIVPKTVRQTEGSASHAADDVAQTKHSLDTFS